MSHIRAESTRQTSALTWEWARVIREPQQPSTGFLASVCSVSRFQRIEFVVRSCLMGQSQVTPLPKKSPAAVVLSCVA